MKEHAVNAFVEAIQQSPQANIVFAPKVTLFLGQEGKVENWSRRPFVMGLKPQKEGDETDVVTHLESFGCGEKIQLKVDLAGDGQLSIKGEFFTGAVEQVEVTSIDLKMSDGQLAAFNVQCPEYVSTSVEFDRTLQAGNSLLLVNLKPLPEREEKISLAQRVTGSEKKSSAERVYQMLMVTPRMMKVEEESETLQ